MREHLHLYLCGSGFSCSDRAYIITQLCSAAYHARQYREPFEAPGLALAASPRLRRFPSALPLMLRVERLILSAQPAHSCGLHPQQDEPRPCKPLPDQGPGAGGGRGEGPAR